MFPEGSPASPATPASPSASSSPAPSAPSEISVAELATRLHSATPPIVAEILGAQYFASGHLPFALNLPLPAFLGTVDSRLG